jgi:hypothetical protein
MVSSHSETINSTNYSRLDLKKILKRNLPSNTTNNNKPQSSYFEIKPSCDILLSESIDFPINKLTEAPLHRSLIDFINLNVFRVNLPEFDRYAWSCLFNGRHMVALPGPNQYHQIDSTHFRSTKSYKNNNNYYKKMNQSTRIDYEKSFNSMSYLCPLLSLIIEKKESNKCELNLLNYNNKQRSYVKESISQSQNGPILLIICASCQRAQQIFEMVNSVAEIAESKSKYIKLKALLIQGGGKEYQYDVPLLNGVDVLISATPMCLLRMLGEAKTNLERLKYLCLDEAHFLLEKYPMQMKTLMQSYANLLYINDKQIVAQIILYSGFWSTKLKNFIDNFMLSPVSKSIFFVN